MRHVCGLALTVASLMLSGCVNSTFDNLSSQSAGCSTTAISVACTAPTVIITPAAVAPTTPSGKPIVNTGNTSGITTGDTTIVLESSVNQTPVGTPAISQLLDSPLNRTIANANMTADQTINFNTNTANNSLWPIAKTLAYSDYGSCINNNGVNTTTAGVCMTGAGGTGLGGNYKVYHFLPGVYDEELQVWAWNQSYATQYRDVSASGTDPQHQAWSFGGNYTLATAMPTSGTVNYVGQWTGTAKTTNFDPNITTVSAPQLDAAGKPVVVNGVAQTINLSQTVVPTNDWRVNGTSALTADFGLGTLNGRLSSTNWQGVDKNKGLTDVDPIAARTYIAACSAGTVAICNTNTQAGQDGQVNAFNYAQVFMNTDVVLNGTIAKLAPLPVTATPAQIAAQAAIVKQNQVTGTAVFDPNKGWLTATGTNPLYAGFFGPVTAGKPKEVTGAFAFKAVTTNPNGGNAGINNDRRGTIEMSGIFNGQ